ncbi:glycerophosphodiester phosphodiesterase [Arthrobacter sp. 9MFCol3.1]|uniref:glycerophosphodiester phosphodiesterase n=1 Tax=Arthrobacter sp. 9MFCol3.1 TaxID=1150398 RepID=UPI0009E0944C|nr:glycerophosphodiester phosphodiesterase family protein [Arthrobacter sp. 9MFCol3.1]
MHANQSAGKVRTSTGNIPENCGPLSRRQAILLGASGLFLAGCTPARPPVETPEIHTVATLFETNRFFVAHRGSGDNWPEHTMQAYVQSVNFGVPALEVSVNATKDGVLVCHHDQSALRVTGQDRKVADLTYAELSGLRVDARAWLGPSTALEPIPKLRDVLDRFAASHVIFIEDKQGTNTRTLLDLMDSYPNSTEHFIWKQPAPALQVAAAAKRGYKTWGYFMPDAIPRLDELAAGFDYLGVYHTADDATVSKVVAYGKPVICWEIHTRSAANRITSLGVQGLMCSNIPYVTSASAEPKDSFSTGSRAAGDLPWTVDQGWGAQPVIDAASASVVLDKSENFSYRLGSMGPVTKEIHSISFEMCWPQELPSNLQHAGIAFGQQDDTPYRVLVPSSVGGYHLIIRPAGELVLYRRDPGNPAGTRLQTIATSPIKPGEWLHFKIDVTPSSIRFSRVDGVGWSGETMDREYRGGYISLCKDYPAPVPVQFRGVSVT